VSDFILPETPEAGEPRVPRVLDYDEELATLRDLRGAVVDLAHGVMTDPSEAGTGHLAKLWIRCC